MNPTKALKEQFEPIRLFDPTAINRGGTMVDQLCGFWGWRKETVQALISTEESVRAWLERMQVVLASPKLDLLTQNPVEFGEQHGPKGLQLQIEDTEVSAGLQRGHYEGDGTQGVRGKANIHGSHGKWTVGFAEQGPIIVNATLELAKLDSPTITMAWRTHQEEGSVLAPISMTISGDRMRGLEVGRNEKGPICVMTGVGNDKAKRRHEVPFDFEKHTKPGFSR